MKGDRLVSPIKGKKEVLKKQPPQPPPPAGEPEVPTPTLAELMKGTKESYKSQGPKGRSNRHG